jgi:hypothetical protein
MAFNGIIGLRDNMTKTNWVLSSETIKEVKNIITEVVEKNKPLNTQQLVKMVNEKTGLAPEAIMPLLVELESENRLHFAKKESFTTTPASRLFSTSLIWLWVTLALSIATLISVYTIPDSAYPMVYLRYSLGIIFVAFLPGYAVAKTIYPSGVLFKVSSEIVDTIERFVLSIGLSLALACVVGLILNYTPWGIKLTPMILCLFAVTVVFSLIGAIRTPNGKVPQS